MYSYWLIGKDPDAGRDWGLEEKGTTRGWDGWMASPTRWTWVWVNSGSGWWTGRPGVLRFMGSQRVGHDWATELNWTEAIFFFCIVIYLLFIIFGRATSSLPWGFALVAANRDCSSLWCMGFSLRCLFLLQSVGLGCAGFRSCCSWAQELWLPASRAETQLLWQRLSCSMAYGGFPDQGSTLCLLHWQADSLALSH